MSQGYYVRYTLGSNYGEIWVLANDPKQAAEIAETQARYRHKSRGKFIWLSILTEEEKEKNKTLDK